MSTERKFVDLAFLMERYDKSKQTIYRWIKHKGFPNPKIKPGLWDMAQVIAWEDKDQCANN